MIFKHLLPAQEQTKEGSGGNLSTCTNTCKGVFPFLKQGFTEVLPAPLLARAVDVLGP